jgi:putative FmdB family regulatory protein
VPTYVYRCKACEHQFETFQKMTDEPVKQCPECKGQVARVLFPPGIVFKGSGFHINDYPSSGSSTSGNGKKSEVPMESKSEPKTETKPEPAAAAKS